MSRNAPPALNATADRLICGLPKAELHIHLEGAIGPELAFRLAQRHGVQLPGMEEGPEGLRRAFEFRNFGDFLRLYVAISSCLQSAEDVALAVAGVAATLAEQNVRYSEMTFTPMTHVARGVRSAELMAGLDEGRRRAADLGVTLAWVFDIVRSFPDQGPQTLALALEGRKRGVVALGVGGPEGPGFPNEPIAPFFECARAEGLHRVPHAGEQDGPGSVRQAIELFHAERIGHGFRCLEDPAVVELVLESGVSLEVCPSSNVALGFVADWSSHPLPELRARGISLSLGSDDPPLFSTTLTDEYRRAVAEFGWGEAEIRELAASAVDQSFMDSAAKRELRRAQAQFRT